METVCGPDATQECRNTASAAITGTKCPMKAISGRKGFSSQVRETLRCGGDSIEVSA